jgi:DNA repair exonuclease SbcCD ATPase subunit
MAQIKKLLIKNFLGIKEIELKPGKVNLIKGKNEQGKTTILEALEKGLRNNDRRVKVINEDGEKTEILIELDNNKKISRRITEKGNYLDLTEDGFTQNAPQTKLKEMVGEFAFNPVDFIYKKADKQAEILLKLLDIEVTEEDVKDWVGEDIKLPKTDYSKHGLKVIEDIKDAFYEKRKNIGREQKKLDSEYTAEINKIPETFEPKQYRGIKLKDKYNELQEIQKHNKKRTRAKNAIIKYENKIQQNEYKKSKIKNENKQKIEKIKIQIEQLKQKINDIKENEPEQLASIKQDIKKIKDKKENAQSFLDNNKEKNTSKLEKEIEEFEEKKELLRTYDSAKENKEKSENKYQEWEKLNETVKIFQNKPNELIEDTKLPIKGLEVKEDQALINGRPIKNLSTEEKIRFGLEIARATASELKLICIDRFESLDPDNQEIMLEEMKKDDFQYFVTEVTGDKEIKVESIIDGKENLKVNAETGEVIDDGVFKNMEGTEFESPFKEDK